MTDHDRGAYTPQTDAPLSFDARRAPGGGQPVPLTLLISGMVLVLLLIGVVYFYRSGVRGPDAPPQVIGAPVGATKAPAPATAQPSDAAAGLQVYKSETAPLSQAQSGGAAGPKFTSAPEQPAPRPAPRPTAPVQTATPPPTAPAPAPVAPPPLAATMKSAIKPNRPLVVTEAVPAPAAAPPAASGVALVQIGAFSSAALADKGWSDTAKVLPGAMVGKTKTVQVVQKDGKTFYRTSVGGFSSKIDAASFCVSLKAAGKSCIVK
jgi:cell division protein FtsN